MAFSRKRLRVPAKLCVVVLSGAAAVACGSGTAPGPDASTDAPFEGGTCTIKTPPGRICMTVCYELASPHNIEEACEAYCDLPDAGKLAGTCYSASGNEYIDCNRQVFADGGAQVLC